MKKILFISLLFIGLHASAQEKSNAMKLAERQAKEFVEFFNLKGDELTKSTSIFQLCNDKIASLESTDMHAETIKEGKFYNIQHRNTELKKLLPAEQVILFEKFENACVECRAVR